MKRAQRRRHLVMWLLIIPVVGFVLVQAIAQRPIPPVNDALPETLQSGAE